MSRYVLAVGIEPLKRNEKSYENLNSEIINYEIMNSKKINSGSDSEIVL
jgi:hypothetical protein